MTQLANTFEGGVDGSALVTGSTTGDAFDQIIRVGSGTIEYDTDVTLVGTTTLRCATTTSADQAFVGWLGSWTGVPEVWARIYGVVAALPTQNTTIAEFREGAATGTSGCDVRLTTTGTLQLRAPQTMRTTSTTALSAGQKFRLELHVVSSSTNGVLEARLYMGANLNGTTPDESFAIGTGFDTGDGTVSGMMAGIVFAVTGTSALTFNIDDLVLSDAGWVGPGVAATVPAAVSDLAGTAGNTQVPLTWTAPSNGGAAITDYVVQYRAAP